MDLTTYLRTGMSHGMQSGAAQVDGLGQRWSVIYTGAAPQVGDRVTLMITDGGTAVQTLIGGGDVSGIDPTFCFTYSDKVYLLAGATVYFSATDFPTKFNNVDGIGNGFVTMSNQTQTSEDLIAMVPFQGKIAFMSRQTTQVWNVNADPASWQIGQVLENVGTVAKLSVKAKGDLDVLFLADNGIRSLRAMAATLNAFVDDVGSPIDTLIQAAIIAHPTEAANACGIVEPSASRYWLFLYDTIYVLSYFPSSKVIAWSTYRPKDSNGATFVPEKFVVRNGRVYCRAGNKVYLYGGSTNQVYDATVATVELPWLNLKNPATMKDAKAINAAFSGAWKITLGMDPVSGILEPTLWEGTSYTFDKGMVPVVTRGTHFKAKFETQGATAAVFSALTFHYDEGEEQ